MKQRCQKYIQSHFAMVSKARLPIPWSDLPAPLQNSVAMFFYCDLLEGMSFFSKTPPAYLTNPRDMNLVVPNRFEFKVRFQTPQGWRHAVGFRFGGGLPESLLR